MKIPITLALAFCPLILEARSSQEPPGLQAHWKFDETSGKTASDASGNGNKGHLRDGAAWAGGTLGGAVVLDGVNDWVDLGTNVPLLKASAGMSVAGWVNVGLSPGNQASADLLFLSTASSRTTARVVLALRGDGAASDLFLGIRSTDAEAQQSLVADANLAAGPWVHVAATADLASGAMSLYVNGALKAASVVPFAAPAFPDTDSRSGSIGAEDRGQANLLSGRLDDLRVYGRALTAAEIAGLAGPGQPSAPTLLSATPGDGRVDLAWTAVVGALSYNVKRRLLPADPFAVIASVPGTTHADLGLTNGTTYRYVVSAVSAGGEGPNSNELTSTPTATPPPVPPAPAITSPASGAILGTGALTVSGTSSGPGLTIALFDLGAPVGSVSSGAGGAWSMPATFAEGSHTLTATAGNGTGTSIPSAPVTFTVDTVAPTVSGLTPSGGIWLNAPSITLTGDASDAGSGVDPSPATLILALNGIVLTPTLTDLGGGAFRVAATPPLSDGLHGFTVQATDLAGHGPTSASASFGVDRTPPVVAISTPTDGQALPGASIALSASVSDGPSGVALAGIQVFLNDSDVTSLVSRTQGTGGDWLVEGTLAGAQENNEIEVRATDLAGNTSSDFVSFTVPAGGLSLTSITPNRVGPGSLVRLAGSGLTSGAGPTKVLFSGLEITEFVSAGPTAIDLQVPLNAASGLVWVEVAGQTSNSLPIEVIRAYSSVAIEALTIFDAQGYAICSMNDANVQLDPLIGPSGAQSIAAAVGATIMGYLPGANNYLFRFPTTSLPDLMSALAGLSGRPGVLRARPRLGLQPQLRTQDEPPGVLISRYERAVSEGRTGFWHFDRIQAPGAWRMLKKSSLQPGGVGIGLFDSGLETMHYEFRTNPLLVGKMLEIRGDFGEVPWTHGDMRDGHGTSMAGLMLAASDDDGISGVLTPPLEGKSPDVRLYVRHSWVPNATKDKIYLWADELMFFIHQCAAKGVKVVNVSMGVGVDQMWAQLGPFLPGLSKAQGLELVIGWATEETMVFRDAVKLSPSVLVVVCAGNENMNLTSDYFLYGGVNLMGGALPNLIVVGGIQFDDNRWEWTAPGFSVKRGSNYADPPDHLGDRLIELAAPAGRLLVPTTASDGASQLLSFQEPFGGDDGTWYKYGDGTSGATALVSGAAALLFCYDASLTAPEAKRLLIDFAHRVRVDLPGGNKVEWDTLKVANSVRGLMLKKGISDDAVPEWSFLYSPSATDTRSGIAKVNKIRWNPELRKYLAPDSQIILDEGGWFAAGPLGDRLITPFYVPPLRDRSELRCYNELPNMGAFEVFHTSNSPRVICGTTQYDVNYQGFPLALGNLEVVFSSMQDFVCDDRASFDLWRRNRTGTSAALTNIQKDTLLKGFLFGSPGGLSDLGDSFRFEFATATQDNRWVLFCNQGFGGDGQILLLPIGSDGKTPTAASLGIKTDPAEHRFLMASLDGNPILKVSQPVVSPDGTRFVFIDAETREVKIGYFFWDVTPLKPLVKPYQITKVHKLPVTCDPFYDRVSWSPDGSHLVFSEAGSSSKKYTIPSASGEYSDPNDVRPQKQVLLEIPGSGGSSQVLQWVWAHW